MNIKRNQSTEFYLIQLNNEFNSNRICKNINKELFYKWFQYYTKTYSNNYKETKIYKKIINCRYTIIQENIKPNIPYQLNQQSVYNSSNQNLMNYIQKYNEYYELIHIPKIKYIYEYYNDSEFIELLGKYLFFKNSLTKYDYIYSINNNDIINSNEELNKDIDLHNSSINDPTDLFDINEVIIDLYEEQIKDNKIKIKISFSIVIDLLNNQNKYFWIKFIAEIENEKIKENVERNLYIYENYNENYKDILSILYKYLQNYPNDI